MESFGEKMNREIKEYMDRWDNLSQEEKDKEEMERDHEKALRIKEYVEKYVPVEEIVPGTNTQDLLKTSEVFRGRPVEDLGKENSGDTGEDLFTDYVSIIFYNLAFDKTSNEGKGLEKIKEYFANRPVVDLGAGPNSGGYNLARLFGAKGYVGVEPSEQWEGLESRLIEPTYNSCPEFFKDEIEKSEIIPFAIIPEDALTFLKRLPDHSVSIINSGTDYYVLFGEAVLPEKERKVKQYISEVNKEITRVLHPDGALLSANSVFGQDGSLEFSEEDSHPYQDFVNENYKIFRLKQEDRDKIADSSE